MNVTVKNYIDLAFAICIYSLVFYKDNKAFRFAETVLVGITAANAIVLNFHNYVKPTIATDVFADGKVWYLIPVALGLLMYTRFAKSIAWLSRIPMGLWLGVGAAYILTRTPGEFISQIQATFMSLDTVNNVVFVVGAVTALAYFFFTVNVNRGPMKGITTLGKGFLLVALGAAFANTVMTRISVLLGRMQFIIQDIFKLGVQ